MNLQTDFWQGAQDTVLIITAEKRWTRGELAACIACYAETLARTDSPEAVIYTRDNLKFIIAFFAALQAGKEVILIQDQPAFRKLEAALKIDDDFIDVARQSGHARLQEVDLSAAQTAFFTSGSSDTPKKIYKTYAALLRELTAVDKYLAPGLKPDTVILTTVSMLHLYGMTFALLYSLAKGLVITGERLDTPEALSAQLAVPGNYWLISSPAFLERLANYRAEYTFASCPYLITSSGGPLSRNGALGLGEIFHTAPVEILGSTETGVVAHRQTALETQWELFPGITAGTDAEGCLVVKSDFAIQPEFTLQDRVQFSGPRHFVLLGRLDRLVKIEEKRVSLPEIEARLAALDVVSQCRTAAVAGKHGRLIIGAVIVLSPAGRQQLLAQGKAQLAAQLKAAVAAALDPVAVPRRIRFVSELPCNSQGKILAADIARILASNLPEPVVLAAKFRENSAEFSLVFLPAAVYFDGHFPALKILPAVIQIYFVQYFARRLLKTAPLSFKYLKKLKFTGLIRPDIQVNLALTVSAGSIKFRYFNAEKIFSSGEIEL